MRCRRSSPSSRSSGLDRTGLLHALTHQISDLNLTIGSAHIGTYGEKAVDVFYVTDLTGQKIMSKPRQRKIHDALMARVPAPRAEREGGQWVGLRLCRSSPLPLRRGRRRSRRVRRACPKHVTQTGPLTRPAGRRSPPEGEG